MSDFAKRVQKLVADEVLADASNDKKSSKAKREELRQQYLKATDQDLMDLVKHYLEDPRFQGISKIEGQFLQNLRKRKELAQSREVWRQLYVYSPRVVNEP